MESKIEFDVSEKEELLVLSNTYESKNAYSNKELGRIFREVRNYYSKNYDLDELVDRVIYWVEGSDRDPVEMVDGFDKLLERGDGCDSPLRETMESARLWLADMYVIEQGLVRYEWETREDY